MCQRLDFSCKEAWPTGDGKLLDDAALSSYATYVPPQSSEFLRNGGLPLYNLSCDSTLAQSRGAN